MEMRSFFLFGPRGTGKSTIIENSLPDAKLYDLLNPIVFKRLLRQPGLIAEETKENELVVIDEIQNMPELLNEVQRLITKRKQKFLLTRDVKT